MTHGFLDPSEHCVMELPNYKQIPHQNVPQGSKQLQLWQRQLLSLFWGGKAENILCCTGQKLITNFSGTPGISRQKSPDIPPKSLVSLGFEGHTEHWGPHLFMCKTPTPPEDILTQEFRLVLLFLPGQRASHREAIPVEQGRKRQTTNGTNFTGATTPFRWIACPFLEKSPFRSPFFPDMFFKEKQKGNN